MKRIEIVVAVAAILAIGYFALRKPTTRAAVPATRGGTVGDLGAGLSRGAVEAGAKIIGDYFRSVGDTGVVRPEYGTVGYDPAFDDPTAYG